MHKEYSDEKERRRRGAVVAHWITDSQPCGPRFESAGSGSIVPLGKTLYPHCLVPRKGLKAVGSLAACL